MYSDLAALFGHVNLCKLAKEWGATRYELMLLWAANDAIEDLARQWIHESEMQ